MKASILLSILLTGSALAKTSPACKKKTTTTATTHKPTTKCTTTSTTHKPTTRCTTTSTSLATTHLPGCNADNCARAVTGTYQGLATQSSHRAQCSSFFSCTAYPSTVTVTTMTTIYPTTAIVSVFPVTETDIETVTTITVVPTVTQISSVFETIIDLTTVTEPAIVVTSTQILADKRDAAAAIIISSAPAPTSSVVCPTAVPAFASACSGTARFSSACSCFGVSKTTTTMATPTTTITQTVTGLTTVTASFTSVVSELVSATSTVPTTILLTSTFSDIVSSVVSIQSTSTFIVVPPAPSYNAYCENGQGVNGLSAPCTVAGCSTTNLRIEGASDTIYEGVILAGPREITTASGGTHLCDGTNDGANPTPFDNGITTIDAASLLCGFTYDGTFDSQFDDFFIERIAGSGQTNNDYWGILVNFAFTAAGGCETEVLPTDELLWAFNAFNVNFFLRVQPTQTPVVLTPGQSTTFTVQGTDGNGDPFVPIQGASFAGSISDANGNVDFVAPTTPGVYRYKATRSDSIRSNAVTVVVQG